jgi:hypothetical protein
MLKESGFCVQCTYDKAAAGEPDPPPPEAPPHPPPTAGERALAAARAKRAEDLSRKAAPMRTFKPNVQRSALDADHQYMWPGGELSDVP